MGNLPKEQNAAVKKGEGKDAKAPVQKVAVPEPGPGQILVSNSLLNDPAFVTDDS